MQKRRNSIAVTLELRHFCIKQSDSLPTLNMIISIYKTLSAGWLTSLAQEVLMKAIV